MNRTKDNPLKGARGFGHQTLFTDIETFVNNQEPIEQAFVAFFYRNHPRPVWLEMFTIDGLDGDWTEVKDGSVVGFSTEEELLLYPKEPSLDYLKRLALLQYEFNRTTVRLYDVSIHTALSLMVDIVIPVGSSQYKEVSKRWLLNEQGAYYFLTGVRKTTSLVFSKLVERYLEYTKDDNPTRRLLLDTFYPEADKTFKEDLLKQKEYISSLSRCLVDVSKLYPSYKGVEGDPLKELMNHHASTIKGI